MELKILVKEPVLMTELANELKVIDKTEIKALQQKTGDYALKFSKLNKDKEAKLFKEILGLEVPRLEREQVATIVNLLPKNETELRTVFAGTKTTVTQENIIKILDTLKQYEK